MTLPAAGFWLSHAGGCLLAGALAWGLGTWLHRRLRLSQAAHGYWFGLWLLAVLPAVAATGLGLWTPAPLAALSSALPLPALDVPSIATLAAASDPGPASAAAAASTPGLPATAWPSVPMLLAMLYLAVAGTLLLRQVDDARRVRRMLRATRPVPASAWPGPASARQACALQGQGIGVNLVGHGTTPFAVRWPQPAIVLPAFALERFNDRQLRLVLRHEAAHLHHRDPQRAAAMRVLGVLFWFDPFLRLLGRRVQLAAELRCDAWALQADSGAGRDFASAYVQTLRLASDQPPVLAALARQQMQGHRLRISRMLDGDPDRPVPRRLGLFMAGLALGAAVALSLGQFALARSADAEAVGGAHVGAGGAMGSGPAAAPVAAPVPAAPVAAGTVTAVMTAAPAAAAAAVATTATATAPMTGLRTPVAGARISSRFGARGNLRPQPHRGIDFAAPRGTAVQAAAAGRVAVATPRYEDGENYGTVVVIDHDGGRQTLYAHLDALDVRTGQTVQAGSLIGRVGTTGKTTGPHLHMELLQQGRHVDPEPHLH